MKGKSRQKHFQKTLNTKKSIVSAKIVKDKIRVSIREINTWAQYDEVLSLSFTAEDLFGLAAHKTFRVFNNGIQD